MELFQDEKGNESEGEMTGIYNRSKSAAGWTVWDLENGWRAVVQYNVFYGEVVTSLSKDEKTWCASDGYDNHYGTNSDPAIARIYKDHIALPGFAREWLEVCNETSGDTLVRPRWERIWEPIKKAGGR